MILGESPGWNEERAGLPFVGKSGQVLEAVLGSVGLHRGDVMIANACRCRIDKEGESTKIVNTAIATCKENVEILIEAMRPKLIITLGVIALRQLTGKQKILENRGKLFPTSYGVPVFATVHPAYLLRGCSAGFPNKPVHTMDLKERIIFEDFKSAMKWLNGQPKKARKRDIEAPSMESQIETAGYTKGTKTNLRKLMNAEVLAVDFETTGLDMHDPNIRVLSVGFCSEKGVSRVYLADEKGRLDPAVLRLLQSDKSKKLVANRSFEDAVCHHKLGITLGGAVHDVQVMAHIYDERSPQYNLEFLADTFTDLKGIKTLAGGKRGSLQDLPVEKLIAYNGVDCDATLRIFNALKRKFQDDDRLARYYLFFIQPVLDMFSRSQNHGLPIDTVALKKAEKIVKGWMTKATNEALRAIPPKVAKDHEAKGLKLTRRDLLIDALFLHPKGYRLRPIKKFITPKTKTPQVTEEHLKQLPDNPLIDAKLRYDKLRKISSTYLAKLWTVIKPDGRVYPTTLMNRTVTGRTVMKSPEVQTVPKRSELAKWVRRCYVAPKGWQLGARDLAQSEVRIMGWLAKDRNILRALDLGIDIHTQTAAVVNGISVEALMKRPDMKKLRQKAKAVNFGFLYGMGAPGFRDYAKKDYGVDMTEEEAFQTRAAFFSKPNGYYRLPVYHRRQKELVLRQGWVDSPLGRRRRLNEALGTREEQSRAFRQAINHPTQSFSSDLALTGMFLFEREVQGNKKLRGNVQVLWFIHDEIMFLAKTRYVRLAHLALKECMEERAPSYIQETFGVTIGYPVASDGKAGPNWQDMKEVPY